MCNSNSIQLSKRKKICTVTGNRLVQGFAWYKMVKISIASEKFIVYKCIAIASAQRYTLAACFTSFPTCCTLIYNEKKNNYFAKRVCFMCHKAIIIILRFRIVFCRLLSLSSSLPPMQLPPLPLQHRRRWAHYLRVLVSLNLSFHRFLDMYSVLSCMLLIFPIIAYFYRHSTPPYHIFKGQ